MKTLHTMKASGTGALEVEPLTIIFQAEPPTVENLDLVRGRYQREAERIVTTIMQHAPGGLVDAILYTLLREKANLFRVPLKD
jgi:hypothetical protein